jgi:N-glycosidase YbiA
MLARKFNPWSAKAANYLPGGIISFYQPYAAWGWLANFSIHPIEMGGRRWPSVEHYFQAQKFAGTDLETQIRAAQSAADAKTLAKLWTEDKRTDWEAVRIEVMYAAVRAKFTQHLYLRDALLSTADALIVENAEDDDFWGRGTNGFGRNAMGQILMKLRSDLR